MGGRRVVRREERREGKKNSESINIRKVKHAVSSKEQEAWEMQQIHFILTF